MSPGIQQIKSFFRRFIPASFAASDAAARPRLDLVFAHGILPPRKDREEAGRWVRWSEA